MYRFLRQDFRPLTNAQKVQKSLQKKQGSGINKVNGQYTSSVLCEEFLTISIINLWTQNAPLVGLTGLEVIGETGNSVDIASVESTISNTNIERYNYNILYFL